MVLQDLHLALRRLWRTPGFSGLSVALPGLSLAALACVFSVVYGLLFKPLPFVQAQRLVMIESRVLGIPFDIGLSTPLRDEFARSAQTLEAVAAYRTGVRIRRDEGGRRIGSLPIALVEPALFSMLGAQPVLGRLFSAEDAAEGAAHNAVLSWDEWQQRFNGASDVIGQRFGLDDREYRIIGVTPRGFMFPANGARVWLPLTFSAAEHDRTRIGSFDGTLTMARLKEGITPEAARDELAGIAQSIPELTSAFGNLPLKITPIRSLWLGNRGDALLLMLLAVSMVWLVTAANVTNLFLARALEGRHAAAIAAALGATEGRRARAVAIEAGCLCLAAAVLAGVLLPVGMALLRHFDLLPAATPQTIGGDAPTWGLIAGLSILLCAMLTTAALVAQRGQLGPMVRHGSLRQTAGSATQAARQSLVVLQVAVTMALLFGIGVLLRSSHNLLAEDIGFQRDHLLLVGLDDLLPHNAAPQVRAARLQELRDQAHALPGVVAVGLGNMIPFADSIATTSFTPPGQEDIKEQPLGYDQQIDAGYFAALGVQLLHGRGFSVEEVRHQAPVAIVDALFVQRYFGDSDPLGKHFRVGVGPDVPDREVTVIGVVPTLKQLSLDETPDRVAIYQPAAAPAHASLAVRTSVEAAALIAPLKALGKRIAPNDALGPIVPFDARIADTLRERTRLNSLLGLLGLLALLLAAVGLYAVLAYAVGQRITEFGVRMALGARPSIIVRQVLGQGLLLVGLGVTLGLPLAWLFARTFSERLFQVSAFDLPTLAAVTLVLGAIALLACLSPARRAAAIDPVLALRNE